MALDKIYWTSDLASYVAFALGHLVYVEIQALCKWTHQVANCRDYSYAHPTGNISIEYSGNL